MANTTAATALDLMREQIGARHITDLAIEASAGTGKTYSLTALFARLIAENADVSVDRILLVTFTRNAASSLRARIREQLLDVLAELTQPTDKLTEFPSLLRQGLGTRVPDAVRRIEVALASLDSASILTIDAFCAQVLRLGGVVVQPEGAEREQGRRVQRAVNDEAIRAASGASAQLIDETRYNSVVAALLQRSAAEPRFETPYPAPPASPEAMVLDRLNRLQTAIQAESSESLDFDEAKRRAVEMLASGGAVLDTLAHQFRYLFIDEAQDTDWKQWELFDLLWAAIQSSAAQQREGAGRVFVGDPKQSIYGFRGADVGSYVHQVEQTKKLGAARMLTKNYRSDPPIVDVLNTVLSSTTYGPSTRYETVESAASAAQLTSNGGAEAPVTLVEIDSLCITTKNGQSQKRYKAHRVVKPAAARVVEILKNSLGVVQKGEPRVFKKSDIAVLTHSGSNARKIQQQLLAWNVAAVSNSTSSVAESDTFISWRSLARALERPSDEGRVRRLLLSPLFGLDGNEPDLRRADFVSERQQLVESWRNTLLEHGIVALALRVLGNQEVNRSLLSGPGFLRRLTDFNHVVELVSSTTRGRGMSPQLLIESLDDIANREATDETAARRVESDDDAVQVMTIHSAKGLEFPVVVVADLWKLPNKRSEPRVVAVHSSDTPQPANPKTRQWLEAAYANGEELKFGSGPIFDREQLDRYYDKKRLFYVGVTRAEHSLSILTTQPMGEKLDLSAALPGGAILDVLNFEGESQLSAGVLHRRDAKQLCTQNSALPLLSTSTTKLVVAPSNRAILRTRDRVSYSDLVDQINGDSNSHGRAVFEEFLRQQDEVGDAAETLDITNDPLMPLWHLPAGGHVGDAFHKVFEHLDVSAADFDSELWRVIRRYASQDFLRPHHDKLFDGIKQVCATPLGPELNNITLRDIDPEFKVAEMRFEAAVSVGTPIDAANVAHIGAYLLERLGSDDPLREYADRLKSTGGSHLIRGTLNGSIDKILPVGSGDSLRFYISDYKSNKVTTPHGARPIDRYTPENLREVMQDAHYPLQALLYGVALHRYLRWRAPQLDADRAIGGWSYLFLRGMLGHTASVIDGGVHGVSTWSSRPYPEFWSGLSSVLMGPTS